MRVDEILSEVEKIAEQLGVRISYEALGGELGPGGLCKVKGEWRAILDRRTTPAERVAILVAALARFPMEGIEMSEPVRERFRRETRRG